MGDAGRCGETISPRQTVNGEMKRKRQRRDLEKGGVKVEKKCKDKRQRKVTKKTERKKS